MRAASVFTKIVIVLSGSCTFVHSFSPASTQQHKFRPPQSQRLHAENGAPQYDKFQATLKKAETLAKGSVLLHIEAAENKLEYEPGHVLALEIQGNVDNEDSHTYEDTIANGGWMRGPYTVTRATDKTLDILIKLVGVKSSTFASAEVGTTVQFGGKFKVPILEGVDVETTKQVILISTGVGIGPCVGAIEKALGTEFPPVQLISSFSTKEEVIWEDYLNELHDKYPKRFTWTPIITKESGRLSSKEENLKLIRLSDINDTHFHLIGNGQMVKEFKEGLKQAGIPSEKVTEESYFNHKATADENAIKRIALVVKDMASVAA